MEMFSFSVRTTNLILAKLAPNMEFKSKYMLETMLRNIVLNQLLLCQKLSARFYFLQNTAPTVV